jgi:Bifunctional DNA primase/polymerase, N-terminal
MAHTRSGGLHLYFRRPADRRIRNTEGARGNGIGPGLDWRGDGGYVIVPSAGSGYWWDPHSNFDTVALAEVPEQLLPRELEQDPTAKPIRPETGLSAYNEAALEDACRRIIAAPAGEQEATINGEAFAIGTLAGASAIPPAFARRALVWAARKVPSYDVRRPWLARELECKVERAFAAGMRQPRGGAHG